MKIEHFNETLKRYPEIGAWMRRVALRVGYERLEQTDFSSCTPVVYVKPEKHAYATQLWRKYRSFDDRTYKLAIRPFKTDLAGTTKGTK